MSNLETLSLSSCSLKSLPIDNYSEISSSVSSTTTTLGRGGEVESTQLENTLQEEDMEYEHEYEDESIQLPKNYIIEFGERDWSSFQR